ncbi:hypothetical protein [Rheinheimera sp. MMS21-TC3]|uniref:hypothetical protein n=1 Tax=Rheinheimera sp. MMS21-TC3 TaxID=3072790 RepID=UPI0028C50B65|nr:hypothetical protein [Rheinheimera sp. MMS21-TC3]WNO61019.1 hypothetical protein RDV63_08660 [Rheinheimera sp. MMS21-TC3]
MELSTDTRFEGIVIPSLVNAYADFLTFDYKITNFTVSINISENIIITFIPKFAPEEGTPLGGKTKYGRVVSYEIDIKTGDIINRSFAR